MTVVEASADLIPNLLEQMGETRVSAMAARLSGSSPCQAIDENIARSTLTWAGIDEVGVVAMGGVIPAAPDAGYIWQFVTDRVRNNLRGYLKMSSDMVRCGLSQYRILVAMIEESYPAAVKHCKRNGFEIGSANPSVNGPVHICVLRRDHV